MIDLRRAGPLAAILVTMALAVAACGGGGATATPAGDATPTPAGEATPADEATPTPEGPDDATPDVAIPTFDLDALTGALPGVDSYRTSYSVDGVLQYQSVVVTKPLLSKAIEDFADDGTTLDSRLIVIGDEAWQVDVTDGTVTAIPGAGASMLMLYDPTLILGAFANLDWATGASDQGTETKNGVQARHLRLDGTTMIGLAGVWPAGAAIDVWVAEAGYLVAWEMSDFEAGQDVSIQVTNVNDPANKVERPS